MLVEVAEVRACKTSCHISPAFRILPEAELSVHARLRVIYTPPPFEFCLEKLTVMQVQELKGLRM